jgi:transposase InsO family protein
MQNTQKHFESIVIPIYSGCSYFIIFIDDLARYSIMYLIKHKLEAFDIKNSTKKFSWKSKRSKYLWLDNGGKYKSNAFNLYCQKHGIKRQFTIPNTPQQNNVFKKQ